MPKIAKSPAAYATWLVLVALGGVALLQVLLTPEQPNPAHRAWFLVPVLWLMFAVPGAVLLHGHALSATAAAGHEAATQESQTASLASARSIWGVLVLGVILSWAVARISGSVSPSVWPGAVMFMLLILARPGTHAAATLEGPAGSVRKQPQ